MATWQLTHHFINDLSKDWNFFIRESRHSALKFNVTSQGCGFSARCPGCPPHPCQASYLVATSPVRPPNNHLSRQEQGNEAVPLGQTFSWQQPQLTVWLQHHERTRSTSTKFWHIFWRDTLTVFVKSLESSASCPIPDFHYLWKAI